jgi:predicted transcriptional regulator
LVTQSIELLRAEREESLDGIRKGLADAAAGRVQPLASTFENIRREFNLSDPA